MFEELSKKGMIYICYLFMSELNVSLINVVNDCRTNDIYLKKLKLIHSVHSKNFNSFSLYINNDRQGTENF